MAKIVITDSPGETSTITVELSATEKLSMPPWLWDDWKRLLREAQTFEVLYNASITMPTSH